MKKIVILVGLVNMYLLASAITILAPKAPPTIPLLSVASENESINLEYYTDFATEVLPKIIKEEDYLFVVPTNVASKLYNKGKDLRLLGITSLGIVHILSSDQTVKNIKDLENKTVYIGAQGSSPDVIARYILEKNNIKVNIKYRTSQEITKLYIAGKIKNVVLPEPLASLADFKNKNSSRLADLTKEWNKLNQKSNGIPQVGLVGSSKYIEKNKKDIELLSREYKKSVEYVNKNTLEIAKIGKIALNLPLPVKVMEDSIKNMNLVYITGKDGYQNITFYLNELKKMDPITIGGALPNEEFFKE